MAWIELHQTLPTNKKTLRLKSTLKIDTPQVVGHLCMLWLWSLDNAQEGDLQPFLNSEIAEVSGWKNDPDVFVDALKSSGFVDSDMRIHDWYEYAGKLIDRRKADAERKRKSNGTPADIQRNSDGCPAEILRYSTLPYSTDTVQNITEEKEEKKILPSVIEESFNRFWTVYPKKVAKQDSLKAWKKVKPCAELVEKIVSAVKAQSASEQWTKENGQYIPNPATWLNRGQWDDEVKTAASKYRTEVYR